LSLISFRSRPSRHCLAQGHLHRREIKARSQSILHEQLVLCTTFRSGARGNIWDQSSRSRADWVQWYNL